MKMYLRKSEQGKDKRFIEHQSKLIERQHFLLNFMLVLGGLILSATIFYSTYISINIHEINSNISSHIEKEIDSYIEDNNKLNRSKDIQNYLDKKLYLDDHQGTFLRLIERDKKLRTPELEAIIKSATHISKDGGMEEQISNGYRNLIKILSEQKNDEIVDRYFKKLISKPVTGEMLGTSYFSYIVKYYLKDFSGYNDEISSLLKKELERKLEELEVSEKRLKVSKYQHSYSSHSINISSDLIPAFYNLTENPKIISQLNHIISLEPNKMKQLDFSNRFIKEFEKPIFDKIRTNMKRFSFKNEKDHTNARYDVTLYGREKTFYIGKGSPLLKRIEDIGSPPNLIEQ